MLACGSKTNCVKKEPFGISLSLISRWPFFVRFTASITLIAFLFTSIPVDYAWAAPQAINTPSDEITIKKIEIPAYLGYVRDSYDAPRADGPIIIHIQDAHCNYQAQNTIYGILDYINKKYGAQRINLEGGKGDYDFSAFYGIGDPELRRKTADYFLKEGQISGAEFYAINNPDKAKLWGVEDAKLYLDNLNVYRDSLKHKGDIDSYVRQLENALAAFKTKMYPPKLLELDRRYRAFKDGSLEFKDYAAYLNAVSADVKADNSDLVNIAIVNKALLLEKGIDFKLSTSERDRLMDRLSKALSRNETKELVQKTVEFKLGHIPHAEFYSYLFGKSKELKIGLSEYKNLNLYVGYITAYAALKKEEIFKEIDTLEGRIKEKLYQNEDQKELDRLSKDLLIIKDLLGVTLTKEEFDYYQNNKKNSNISNFSKFINRLAPKYGLKITINDGIGKLDSYITEMERFYTLSYARDNEFVKNIKFSGQGQRIAVLVTGGFHTDNLTSLLKKKGISYISIMPSFGMDGAENPYFKLLSGDNSALFKFIMANTSTLAIWSPFNDNAEAIYGTSKEALARATADYVRVVSELSEAKEGEEIVIGDGDSKLTFSLRMELPEGGRIVCGWPDGGFVCVVPAKGMPVVSPAAGPVSPGAASRASASGAALSDTQKAAINSERSKVRIELDDFLKHKLGPNLDPGYREAIAKAVDIVYRMSKGEGFEVYGYKRGELEVIWHDITHSGRSTIEASTAMISRIGQNRRKAYIRAIAITALAGMYHDVGDYMDDEFGFGTMKVEHEKRSKEFILKNGERFGITDPADRLLVCLAISATEMGVTPNDWNELEKAVKSGDIEAVRRGIESIVKIDGIKIELTDEIMDALPYIIYGARLLGVLDVYDTRENAVDAMDYLRIEFTRDQQALERWLDRHEGAADEASDRAQQELGKLKITQPNHALTVAVTKGFYDFVKERVAGFGVWSDLSDSARANFAQTESKVIKAYGILGKAVSGEEKEKAVADIYVLIAEPRQTVRASSSGTPANTVSSLSRDETPESYQIEKAASPGTRPPARPVSSGDTSRASASYRKGWTDLAPEEVAIEYQARIRKQNRLIAELFIALNIAGFAASWAISFPVTIALTMLTLYIYSETDNAAEKYFSPSRGGIYMDPRTEAAFCGHCLFVFGINPFFGRNAYQIFRATRSIQPAPFSGEPSVISSLHQVRAKSFYELVGFLRDIPDIAELFLKINKKDRNLVKKAIENKSDPRAFMDALNILAGIGKYHYMNDEQILEAFNSRLEGLSIALLTPYYRQIFMTIRNSLRKREGEYTKNYRDLIERVNLAAVSRETIPESLSPPDAENLQSKIDAIEKLSHRASITLDSRPRVKRTRLLELMLRELEDLRSDLRIKSELGIGQPVIQQSKVTRASTSGAARKLSREEIEVAKIVNDVGDEIGYVERGIAEAETKEMRGKKVNIGPRRAKRAELARKMLDEIKRLSQDTDIHDADIARQIELEKGYLVRAMVDGDSRNAELVSEIKAKQAEFKVREALEYMDKPRATQKTRMEKFTQAAAGVTEATGEAMVELINRRNKLAREYGYVNYADLVLKASGLTVDDVFGLTQAIKRDTQKDYDIWLNDLKRTLRARYKHLRGKEIYYTDMWLPLGDGEKALQAALPRQEIKPFSEKFLADMGVKIKDSMVKRYEDGMWYAVMPVDPGKRVNMVMPLDADAQGIDMAGINIHESLHAFHFSNIDYNQPAIYRYSDAILLTGLSLTEAIAIFGQKALMQPETIKSLLKARYRSWDEKKLNKEVRHILDQDRKKEIASMRRLACLTEFELWMYQQDKELTLEDIRNKYNEVWMEFVGIKDTPSRREEDKGRTWGRNLSLAENPMYQGAYVFGSMIADEILAEAKARYGKAADPRVADEILLPLIHNRSRKPLYDRLEGVLGVSFGDIISGTGKARASASGVDQGNQEKALSSAESKKSLARLKESLNNGDNSALTNIADMVNSDVPTAKEALAILAEIAGKSPDGRKMAMEILIKLMYRIAMSREVRDMVRENIGDIWDDAMFKAGFDGDDFSLKYQIEKLAKLGYGKAFDVMEEVIISSSDGRYSALKLLADLAAAPSEGMQEAENRLESERMQNALERAIYDNYHKAQAAAIFGTLIKSGNKGALAIVKGATKRTWDERQNAISLLINVINYNSSEGDVKTECFKILDGAVDRDILTGSMSDIYQGGQVLGRLAELGYRMAFDILEETAAGNSDAHYSALTVLVDLAVGSSEGRAEAERRLNEPLMQNTLRQYIEKSDIIAQQSLVRLVGSGNRTVLAIIEDTIRDNGWKRYRSAAILINALRRAYPKEDVERECLKLLDGISVPSGFTDIDPEDLIDMCMAVREGSVAAAKLLKNVLPEVVEDDGGRFEKYVRLAALNAVSSFCSMEQVDESERMKFAGWLVGKAASYLGAGGYNARGGSYSDMTRSIFDDTGLPLELRLYAFGMLPSGDRVDEAEKLARQLMEQDSGSTSQELLPDDNIWFNEKAKVYYLSTWLIVSKSLGGFISDEQKYQMISKIMTQTNLTEYFIFCANAAFDIGRRSLIDYATSAKLVFSVFAHELGHNVLDLILRDKPCLPYQKFALGEMIADFTAYAFLERMGWNEAKFELRELNSRHWEDVFGKAEEDKGEGISEEAHEAARAAIEELYREFDRRMTLDADLLPPNFQELLAFSLTGIPSINGDRIFEEMWGKLVSEVVGKSPQIVLLSETIERKNEGIWIPRLSNNASAGSVFPGAVYVATQPIRASASGAASKEQKVMAPEMMTADKIRDYLSSLLQDIEHDKEAILGQYPLMTAATKGFLDRVYNDYTVKNFPEGMRDVWYPASGYDAATIFRLTNARKAIFTDQERFVGEETFKLSNSQWIEELAGLYRIRGMGGYMISGNVHSTGTLIPLLAEIVLMGGKITTPMDALARAIADGDKVITIDFNWSRQEGGLPEAHTAIMVSDTDIKRADRYPDVLKNLLTNGVQAVVLKAAEDIDNDMAFLRSIENVITDRGLIFADAGQFNWRTDFERLGTVELGEAKFSYTSSLSILRKPVTGAVSPRAASRASASGEAQKSPLLVNDGHGNRLVDTRAFSEIIRKTVEAGSVVGLKNAYLVGGATYTITEDKQFRLDFLSDIDIILHMPGMELSYAGRSKTEQDFKDALSKTLSENTSEPDAQAIIRQPYHLMISGHPDEEGVHIEHSRDIFDWIQKTIFPDVMNKETAKEYGRSLLTRTIKDYLKLEFYLGEEKYRHDVAERLFAIGDIEATENLRILWNRVIQSGRVEALLGKARTQDNKDAVMTAILSRIRGLTLPVSTESISMGVASRKSTSGQDLPKTDRFRTLPVDVVTGSAEDIPLHLSGQQSREKIEEQLQEAKALIEHMISVSPQRINEWFRNLGFTIKDEPKLTIRVSYHDYGEYKMVFKLEVEQGGERGVFLIAMKTDKEGGDFFQEGERAAYEKLQGSGLVPELGGIAYIKKTGSKLGEVSSTPFSGGEKFKTVMLENFIEGNSFYDFPNKNTWRTEDARGYTEVLLRAFFALNQGRSDNLAGPFDLHAGNVMKEEKTVNGKEKIRYVLVDLGKQRAFSNIEDYLYWVIFDFRGKRVDLEAALIAVDPSVNWQDMLDSLKERISRQRIEAEKRIEKLRKEREEGGSGKNAGFTEAALLMNLHEFTRIYKMLTRGDTAREQIRELESLAAQSEEGMELDNIMSTITTWREKGGGQLNRRAIITAYQRAYLIVHGIIYNEAVNDESTYQRKYEAIQKLGEVTNFLLSIMEEEDLCYFYDLGHFRRHLDKLIDALPSSEKTASAFVEDKAGDKARRESASVKVIKELKIGGHSIREGQPDILTLQTLHVNLGATLSVSFKIGDPQAVREISFSTQHIRDEEPIPHKISYRDGAYVCDVTFDKAGYHELSILIDGEKIGINAAIIVENVPAETRASASGQISFFQGNVDLGQLDLPEWTKPLGTLTNSEVRLLVDLIRDDSRPLYVASPGTDFLYQDEIISFLVSLKGSDADFKAMLERLRQDVWKAYGGGWAQGIDLHDSLKEMHWIQQSREKSEEAALSLVGKLSNMIGRPPSDLSLPQRTTEVLWDAEGERLVIRLPIDYSGWREDVLKVGPLEVKLDEAEHAFLVLGDAKNKWRKDREYWRAFHNIARNYMYALEVILKNGRLSYRKIAGGAHEDMEFVLDKQSGKILGIAEGYEPEVMQSDDPKYLEFRDGIFDLAQLARAILLKERYKISDLSKPVNQELLLDSAQDSKAFPNDLIATSKPFEPGKQRFPYIYITRASASGVAPSGSSRKAKPLIPWSAAIGYTPTTGGSGSVGVDWAKKTLDQIASSATYAASFEWDLRGAEVLIIGPGKSADEILRFIELYPAIKAIHVVDSEPGVFLAIAGLIRAKYGFDGLEFTGDKLGFGSLRKEMHIKENGKEKKPVIYPHMVADVKEGLPSELRGKIDLEFDSNVFEPGYFIPGQLEQVARHITDVLKPGGVHISFGSSLGLDDAAFAGQDMSKIDVRGLGPASMALDVRIKPLPQVRARRISSGIASRASASGEAQIAPSAVLDQFVSANPELKDMPEIAKLKKMADERKIGAEFATYIVDLYEKSKTVFDNTRPIADQRIICIPLEPRLFSGEETATIETLLQKMWASGRHAFDKKGFSGIKVIFYEKDKLDELSVRLSAQQATNKNTVMYIDENLAAATAAALSGYATIVQEQIPDSGTYISISAHVILAIAILDVIRNGRDEKAFFSRIADLIGALGANMEGIEAIKKRCAQCINSEQFIEMLKKGDIKILLPPIEKIDVNRNTEAFRAIEAIMAAA